MKLNKKFIFFAVLVILALAIVFVFFLRRDISASTSSVTPTPVVMGATGTEEVTFHKGFNAYGKGLIHASDYLTQYNLRVYEFKGQENKWNIFPGQDDFLITAFRGYYVYNPDAEKTVTLPSGPGTTTAFSINKGWNLLWSANAKNLNSTKLEDSLQFMYNGQQVLAKDLLNNGTIYKNIFIIDNDQSADSCTYFKILGQEDVAANCSGGNQTIGVSSQIPAGKAFWVYVYSQPSPQITSTGACTTDYNGSTICS